MFWKGTLRLAQGRHRARLLLLNQGDSEASFKPRGAVVLRVWLQARDHLFRTPQGGWGSGEGETFHESQGQTRHPESGIPERMPCQAHLPSCQRSQCLDCTAPLYIPMG